MLEFFSELWSGGNLLVALIDLVIVFYFIYILLLLIRGMYLSKELCFEHCQELLGIATVSLDLFPWLLGNQRWCNEK